METIVGNITRIIFLRGQMAFVFHKLPPNDVTSYILFVDSFIQFGLLAENIQKDHVYEVTFDNQFQTIHIKKIE